MAELRMSLGVTRNGVDQPWELPRGVAITLVVMAMGVLPGCGILGGTMSDKPTINQSQAEARIDQLIAQATEGLDPQPKLERLEDENLLRKCLDPSDGGSEDRVILSKSYWLEGIPKKKPNAAIAEQVKANVEEAGHEIYSSKGLGTNQPEVFVASRPDDFRMSLVGSSDGSLSIGASSPCIWQDGTPGGEPTMD